MARQLPAEERKAVVLDLPLSVGLPESYIQETTRCAFSCTGGWRALENEEQRFARSRKSWTTALASCRSRRRTSRIRLRLKLAAAELGAQSITTDGNRFTIRADGVGTDEPHTIAAIAGRGLRDWAHAGVVYSRSGTPEQWKNRLMDVVRKLNEMKASAAPTVTPQAMPAHLAAEPLKENGLPPMAEDEDW